MSIKQDQTSYHRPEDSPTAWFAVLERARQTNDFELAERAHRELERLGVKVTYGPHAAGTRKAVRDGR
jgi:hypothetical protein